MSPPPRKRRPKQRFRRERAVERGKTAREAAFAVLSEYKNTGTFVAKLLESVIDRSSLTSPEDRRLAFELTHGVVRREATLDALIGPHVQRPRHRVEGELWTLIQLGVYQLVFLDSIPAYAAVNETVALAKAIGRDRWSGFLNGVLRSVERFLGEQFEVLPAGDTVPIAREKYRKLTHVVFPKPADDPVGYFAAAFSFPRWLSRRWYDRFGLEELCRIGFWFNQPASMSLRVNRLRTSRDELLAKLEGTRVSAKAGELPEAILLEGTTRVDALPGFAAGLFSVQDESAMQAVARLDPQPGETVLDLCAAPGTKTTHIAERMQNQGTIVATDIRAGRFARVEQSCARLGITIVQPRSIPEKGPSEADLQAGPFDRILVDVPCSNTGVLGKRPEARWRMTASEITELAGRQAQLLEFACRQLKSGGRLVYSTCSIESEENEQIVRGVLEQHPEMSLVTEWQHRPGEPGDGGYQALLTRS